MSENIPNDIMASAEEALDNLLCNCRESCGSTEAVRQASITDIATAILAERKRCLEVVSDHISVLRKLFQNDVARALEQVRAEITAENRRHQDQDTSSEYERMMK